MDFKGTFANIARWLDFRASLVAQTVKRLPTVWKTLGWEDLLEKEMATHSSIHAWKIPWTEWGRKELDRTERLHFHFL